VPPVPHVQKGVKKEKCRISRTDETLENSRTRPMQWHPTVLSNDQLDFRGLRFRHCKEDQGWETRWKNPSLCEKAFEVVGASWAYLCLEVRGAMEATAVIQASHWRENLFHWGEGNQLGKLQRKRGVRVKVSSRNVK